MPLRLRLPGRAGSVLLGVARGLRRRGSRSRAPWRGLAWNRRSGERAPAAPPPTAAACPLALRLAGVTMPAVNPAGPAAVRAGPDQCAPAGQADPARSATSTPATPVTASASAAAGVSPAVAPRSGPCGPTMVGTDRAGCGVPGSGVPGSEVAGPGMVGSKMAAAGVAAAGVVGGGRAVRPRIAVARLVGCGWMLWRAPRAVARRIVLVGLAWLALCGFALSGLRWRWTDLMAFGAFLALGAVAVAAAARLGEDLAVPRIARHDLLATWAVAVAVLLPPFYPAVIGLPLCWLSGRADPVRPPHLRMFQAATLGIAGYCASAVHLLLSPDGGRATVDGLVGSGPAVAAFLAAVAVFPMVASLPALGMVRAGRQDGLDAWLGVSPRATIDPPVGPYVTAGDHGPNGLAGPGRSAAAPSAPVIPGRAVVGAPGGVVGTVPGRDASRVEAAGGTVAGRAGLSRHAGTEGLAGSRLRPSRHEAVPARAAEICTSIIVAVLWAASPLLILAVAPPMLLLQRSLVHTDLLHAARTDAKTRLANPAYWRQVAEREFGRVGRDGRPLSVLLVDIDHFKRVNDRFGHLVGDVILVAVADALRAATRPRDLVGRFGGEEFVVLLSEIGRDNALDVAERIRRQVAGTRCGQVDGGPPLSVTVSVGVATHHGAPGDLSALLARADSALYRAKADGRNRVRLADPVYAPV
ncbi:conserved membrane hypothetical protein [Frankia canadensis]|uniref:GGDEF domain-containing protein n=1 Tax=Frankia canadensis TaxID=1836972 RepID=A0A2I2KYX4_9ACTN|nr:GGDEF domain-containing protein [Frankia canadensis]SNQ50858.1 conserved membrane hypothetical protein [Frankia canadensis]SOU58148.1 conserved membrane hypothetical protein [Frankia canadensis]